MKMTSFSGSKANRGTSLSLSISIGCVMAMSYSALAAQDDSIQKIEETQKVLAQVRIGEGGFYDAEIVMQGKISIIFKKTEDFVSEEMEKLFKSDPRLKFIVGRREDIKSIIVRRVLTKKISFTDFPLQMDNLIGVTELELVLKPNQGDQVTIRFKCTETRNEWVKNIQEYRSEFERIRLHNLHVMLNRFVPEENHHAFAFKEKVHSISRQQDIWLDRPQDISLSPIRTKIQELQQEGCRDFAGITLEAALKEVVLQKYCGGEEDAFNLDLLGAEIDTITILRAGNAHRTISYFSNARKSANKDVDGDVDDGETHDHQEPEEI